MITLIYAIAYLAATVVAGCLWGLIPFFLGRYRYRPNMGRWGFIWCGVAGPFVLSFLVAVGFVVAILTSERDMRPVRQAPPAAAAAVYPAAAPLPQQQAAPTGLVLTCLAGPLKGQTYPISQAGVMFGRDADCTVRFPSNTAGVSRHHCALRWQQGVPVLVPATAPFWETAGSCRPTIPPLWDRAAAFTWLPPPIFFSSRRSEKQ